MNFTQIMQQEQKYALAEMQAAESNDYKAAECFNKLRFKCMDAAVKVEQRGKANEGA